MYFLVFASFMAASIFLCLKQLHSFVLFRASILKTILNQKTLRHTFSNGVNFYMKCKVSIYLKLIKVQLLCQTGADFIYIYIYIHIHAHKINVLFETEQLSRRRTAGS